MPFGAECRPDGQVRFRLWAPAPGAVFVQLVDSGRRLAMEPVGRGWFELVTSEAGPGSRYRFELPDGLGMPDPASRRQDGDVHDASIVVDPAAYRWRHPQWKGRPWHEAVISEIHVGSFSPEGSFAGLKARLPELAGLGITAIQLMPVADFAGRWNWGYDGVLPYAPDGRYGTPEDLKALIDAAHGLGLMVFLDVVYNHFGPEGNYLHRYAPAAFTDRHRTPWGAAIDFSQGPMRDFFAHNAAYWIEEFRFDGLRLDAVHAIVDHGAPHVLESIAAAARAAAGPGRRIHLILENDDNAARLLGGHPYDAQWNDDFHHAAHVLLTGERHAYYADYAEHPLRSFGRALAEGFVYQGEVSAYRGRPRGEDSAGLPTTAFVNFLQNHDQIGNRGGGERLAALADPRALRALMAVLLLAPSIPMLFMGEEHAAPEPFLFFVDFPPALARAVREGRKRELRRYPGFVGAARALPDPAAPESFHRSAIDWSKRSDPVHAEWLRHCRELLALRRAEIVPRLSPPPRAPASFCVWEPDLLTVDWDLPCGERLRLLARLSAASGAVAPVSAPGRALWTSARIAVHDGEVSELPAWFVGWFLDGASAVAPER